MTKPARDWASLSHQKIKEKLRGCNFSPYCVFPRVLYSSIAPLLHNIRISCNSLSPFLRGNSQIRAGEGGGKKKLLVLLSDSFFLLVTWSVVIY